MTIDRLPQMLRDILPEALLISSIWVLATGQSNLSKNLIKADYARHLRAVAPEVIPFCRKGTSSDVEVKAKSIRPSAGRLLDLFILSSVLKMSNIS